MNTKLLTVGAVAVGGFLLYQHMRVRVIPGGFGGYEILKKGGYFYAREVATGKISMPMPDLTTVQRYMGANAAATKLKQWIPGMGDDLLLPPPGRTVTADGQVLDGLGYHIDSYDATPSQYRRDVINDLGDLGWGGSIGRAVSRAVSNVSNVVKKAVPAPVRKIVHPMAYFTKTIVVKTGTAVGIIKKPKAPEGGGTEYQDADGNVISKAEYERLLAASEATTPRKAEDYRGCTIWTVAKISSGVSGLSGFVQRGPQPKASPVKPSFGINTSRMKPHEAAQAVRAAEAREKARQEAEASRKAEEARQAEEARKAAEAAKEGSVPNITTSGVVYLVNFDPVAYTAEGSYATMAEAKAAIDAVWAQNQPKPIMVQQPAVQQPMIQRPAVQYDVEQAAREQASMERSASDDSGFGPTSDDSGFGPARTVTEDGAPALPERVATVESPAPVMLPAAAPPPAAPEGNKAVAAVVGGGIIAAIAAAAFS